MSDDIARSMTKCWPTSVSCSITPWRAWITTPLMKVISVISSAGAAAGADLEGIAIMQLLCADPRRVSRRGDWGVGFRAVQPSRRVADLLGGSKYGGQSLPTVL